MVSPSLVIKVKHVDRVLRECLFQGYPIISKVKIPFVLRVFEKDTERWKEFDGKNFQERKKRIQICV